MVEEGHDRSLGLITSMTHILTPLCLAKLDIQCVSFLCHVKVFLNFLCEKRLFIFVYQKKKVTEHAVHCQVL